MERIIVIITFIPWFLYFYSEIKSITKIIKSNMDNEHYIKDNWFNIFPITNIILYAILIYFSIIYNEATNIFAVRVMLFSAINLYLFFNNISKKDYVLIFENSNEKISMKYVFLALLPVVFYLFSTRQMITYSIMMALNMFAFFLIKILGISKDEK